MTDQSSVPADTSQARPPGEPEPQHAAGESGASGVDDEVAVAPAEPTPVEAVREPTALEAGTGARKRNRALIATAIGASYAVLAAGTAAAVVAVGSPAPVAAVGQAAAPASPSATTAPIPSISALSSSPTPSASPTPTVTGHVSGGIHSGDLRYFLLSPPDGPSSVQGDPNGDLETLSTVLTEYGGASGTRSILTELGFKSGATRTYQDSSLGANVTIELIQFGSSGKAAEWQQGFQLGGSGFTAFSVPGESGASAWSKSAADDYTLIGTYYAGDAFYEITVYGTQTLPDSDLSDLMKAEHGRLSNG